MNHLDEGTIHAWLDGALDTAQSREVEAHVAACPACAASVAEARGLIAGASRILGALDEVPGGVIPGRSSPAPVAPVAPVAGGVRDSGVKPFRPRWRVAPWATGLAAVLLAAVVLRTGMRTNARMDAQGELRGADSVGAAAVGEAAADTQARSLLSAPAPEPVTPPPSASAVTSRTSIAAPTARAVPERAQAREELTATPAATDLAAKQQRAAVGAAGVSAGKTVARAPAEAPPSRAMVAAQVDTATLAQRAEQRLRRMGSSPVALSEVVVTGAAEGPAESQSFQGCYRLAVGDSPRSGAGAAAGAVAGVVADNARRARAREAPQSAPAAAPSAPVARADYSSGRIPPIVRLDTVRVAMGLAVVDAGTGASTGWWRVLRDTAWLDLGTRGVFMLPRSAKVECP